MVGPGPSTTGFPDSTVPEASTSTPDAPTTAVTTSPVIVPRRPTTTLTATVPVPTTTLATVASTETIVAMTVITSATTTTGAIAPVNQNLGYRRRWILGCGFQPSSASAPAGSTMRFRNGTGDSVIV
jgi:hypothetical protein